MFNDDAYIRHYLISQQILSEQQISEAIDYALEHKLQLDAALVALDMMSFERLGSYLAEIHQMPYRPLLARQPSPFCKKILPFELVEKWSVYPVEFDPENDLLTIAVANPDQIRSFIRLEQKLFAHHRLGFCIASQAEIESAIGIYYKQRSADRESTPEVPHDFSILNADEPGEPVLLQDSDERDSLPILLFDPDIDKGRSLRSLLHHEGYRKVTWVSSEREASRLLRTGGVHLLALPDSLRASVAEWPVMLDKTVKLPRLVTYRSLAPLVLGQEQPYQAMSGCLTALVGAMVRERLANDPDRIRETVERARYAKLLALRLQLPSFQVDRVVLASWLFETERFGSLVTPLAQLFDPGSLIDEASGHAAHRHPESRLLSIVQTLIDIKKTNPGIGNDIAALRERLREQAPDDVPQHTIETLLAILVDEAFISRIDRPAARVLIVDPDAMKDSSLVLRLQNDGYEVETVPDVKQALERIGSGKTDCIISEIAIENASGIDLCRTVKNNPVAGVLPFMFIAGATEKREMAEGLRAGADDFLPKPVDPEVVALKLHRLLSKKFGYDARPGIKGDLAQMDIADLVQILSSSQKSVKVTLTENGRSGEVYLEHGEVVHAVLDPLTGEAAFYRLMRRTQGTFEVVPCAAFPKRTITMSVMELLMEGARIDDEAANQAAFSAAPPPPAQTT